MAIFHQTGGEKTPAAAEAERKAKPEAKGKSCWQGKGFLFGANCFWCRKAKVLFDSKVAHEGKMSEFKKRRDQIKDKGKKKVPGREQEEDSSVSRALLFSPRIISNCVCLSQQRVLIRIPLTRTKPPHQLGNLTGRRR